MPKIWINSLTVLWSWKEAMYSLFGYNVHGCVYTELAAEL